MNRTVVWLDTVHHQPLTHHHVATFPESLLLTVNFRESYLYPLHNHLILFIYTVNLTDPCK